MFLLDEEESIFRPQVRCDDGIHFLLVSIPIFRVSKTLIHHRARLAPTYSAKRLLHQKNAFYTFVSGAFDYCLRNEQS